jgi:hypothetical protein
MALGSGGETPAGTLAGECWLAVQADSAATQTAAAAATTLTARMLIRRTAPRQGCAAVSAARGRDPFRGSRVPHGMPVPKPIYRDQGATSSTGQHAAGTAL